MLRGKVPASTATALHDLVELIEPKARVAPLDPLGEDHRVLPHLSTTRAPEQHPIARISYGGERFETAVSHQRLTESGGVWSIPQMEQIGNAPQPRLCNRPLEDSRCNLRMGHEGHCEEMVAIPRLDYDQGKR